MPDGDRERNWPLTVADVPVLRRRPEGRDDALHHGIGHRDPAQRRRHLGRAVRKERRERDKRRKQPEREEAQQDRKEAQEAGGERGEQGGCGEEGEDAADDGDVVARVEDVVGVDGDLAARGGGALEVALLVVELDEGVDADAHAYDAKGEEEEEGEEERQPVRVVDMAGTGRLVAAKHGWEGVVARVAGAKVSWVAGPRCAVLLYHGEKCDAPLLGELWPWRDTLFSWNRSSGEKKRETSVLRVRDS